MLLELAKGGSLRGVLSDTTGTPSLPWPLRTKWLGQIAAGMAELHAMRPVPIVHRDLKASNVLLSSPDHECAVLKICDYGLAAVVQSIQSSLSSSGGGAGTMAWKAAETFKGRYSKKSDVYALGVTLYEIVTRRFPFQGLGMPEIARKAMAAFEPREDLQELGISMEKQRELWIKTNPLQSRRPNLAEQVEAGCPEELKALTIRCWADEPAERPSFQECLSMCEAKARSEAAEASWKPPHWSPSAEGAPFEVVKLGPDLLAVLQATLQTSDPTQLGKRRGADARAWPGSIPPAQRRLRLAARPAPNPRPALIGVLLKCHRSIPGHSIAAVREVKSSLVGYGRRRGS